MDPHELYAGLAVALAVGFLIGLQREQTAAKEPDGRSRSVGGIRTFPLVSLGGAFATLLDRGHGAWVMVGGLFSIVALLAIAYADDLRRDRERGLTTEVSFLLAYLLGAFCMADAVVPEGTERLLLSAAAGVAVTALLSLKHPLAAWAEKVSSEDLYATLKFAVLAVVVLPLLPNQAMGPYSVLNPRSLGILVVLIAGVSFAGYIAIRVLGTGRGLGVTGLVGGLASSTAVTLGFSSSAKKQPETAVACALGILLACTVMAVRVLVIAGVVNRSLLPTLSLPIGGLAVGGLVASVVLYLASRKDGGKADAVKISNPFELGSALKMGAVFAVVLVLSKAAQIHLGERGVYLASGLAGLTDVDAALLSMAKLAGAELSATTASVAILIAAASNTLVKAGMTVALGGPALAKRALPAFAAMIAGGALGAVALIWKG